jgi:hypothetical protein
MSFWTIVKDDATAVEQDVVNGLKAAVTYVDNIIVLDVEPALAAAFSQALQLIRRNGGTLLLSAATNVLPSLVAGQWGTAVTNLLADAKAAGATTVSSEEQLAASTALQIQQAVQASVATATPAPPVPAAT